MHSATSSSTRPPQNPRRRSPKLRDQIKALRDLVEKSPDGRLTLAAIYEGVYPGKKASSQRVEFAGLRSYLEKASEESGRHFALEKPDRRGLDQDEIVCEFTGDKLAPDDAADRFTAEAVSKLDREKADRARWSASPPGASWSELKAAGESGGPTIRAEKRLIRFFVSPYAHADEADLDALPDPRTGAEALQEIPLRGLDRPPHPRSARGLV
ncbi:MAG: hypothetical protein R3F11_22260 [Verrucomicrobiales bacterium]